MLDDGRLAEAEKAISQSVEALEELTKKHPKHVGYQEEAAYASMSLGRVYLAAGRNGEAEKAFQRSIVRYEVLRAKRPTRIAYTFYLACLYADCPVERLRDLPRAVGFAMQAVEIEPRSSPHWVTLGVAHYRQGEWKAAVNALEIGLRQNLPDVGRGTFYLAMVYARQGEVKQARRTYEKALNWMDKHQPRSPEVIRWRTEVGELLSAFDLPGRQ
jgi:tetratricopeptide (TPR) repeat protein